MTLLKSLIQLDNQREHNTLYIYMLYVFQVDLYLKTIAFKHFFYEHIFGIQLALFNTSFFFKYKYTRLIVHTLQIFNTQK